MLIPIIDRGFLRPAPRLTWGGGELSAVDLTACVAAGLSGGVGGVGAVGEGSGARLVKVASFARC